MGSVRLIVFLFFRWQDCERDCTKVLGLTGQAENVKALYRRALARKERKLFEEARNGTISARHWMLDIDNGCIKDLEVLLKVEPANAAAKEELSDVKKAIKVRYREVRVPSS
jgi:hypothetical protein